MNGRRKINQGILAEEIPEGKKEYPVSIFNTVLSKWKLNKSWINLINLFKIFLL